jgi:hypothetical protein
MFPGNSRQRGQSLAEFALCLPLFLLLVFGVIQLALLAQAAFFTHYAAHCAARAYAVFVQQGKETALKNAREAAGLGLAGARPRLEFELELLPARQAGPGTDIPGLNRQMFEMRLTAFCPLVFPFLKPIFSRGSLSFSGVPVKATVCMQSEDNDDFRRAQEILKDEE